MPTRYIIELRTRPDPNGGPPLMPSLQAIDGETLPLVCRDVEKSLLAAQADEAVIYAPVRVLRAARQVTTHDVNGRTIDDEPLLKGSAP